MKKIEKYKFIVQNNEPKINSSFVELQGKRLIDVKLSLITLKFLGVNPSKEYPQNKLFFKYFDRDNPKCLRSQTTSRFYRKKYGGGMIKKALFILSLILLRPPIDKSRGGSKDKTICLL